LTGGKGRLTHDTFMCFIRSSNGSHSPHLLNGFRPCKRSSTNVRAKNSGCKSSTIYGLPHAEAEFATREATSLSESVDENVGVSLAAPLSAWHETPRALGLFVVLLTRHGRVRQARAKPFLLPPPVLVTRMHKRVDGTVGETKLRTHFPRWEYSRPYAVVAPSSSTAESPRRVTRIGECVNTTTAYLPEAAPQLACYDSLAALLRLMKKFVLAKTDLHTKNRKVHEKFHVVVSSRGYVSCMLSRLSSNISNT